MKLQILPVTLNMCLEVKIDVPFRDAGSKEMFMTGIKHYRFSLSHSS